MPSTHKAACLSPEAPPAAELIVRYDQRVPRYTSYPTAPHFHAGVGERQYRQWLGELDGVEAVSLYAHVPFCERLCWYCGCHTTAVRRYDPVAEYVATLLAEIDLVADAIDRPVKAGAIHFGGGTPNILALADFVRVVEKLQHRFRPQPGAEFAVECDPRGLAPDWVERAVALGVNRVSLGVQDVDPVVQRAINRWQPFATTAAAVEMLRRAGIGSVNLDLMYGLPQQTAAGLRATIDAVMPLAPDRIALFGYAHVPWMKPHQALIPGGTLPGTVERFRQQAIAADMLEERGYVRIGLDHFARSDDPLARALVRGDVRRNFQGYTTDDAETLIGLGTSAIGRLPGRYVQNAAKVPDWRAAVEAGRLPVARGIVLTAEDRFRAEIIGRLMCDFAVDLAEVAGRHDTHVDGILPDLVRLCGFEEDGLIERRDGHLLVTRLGRPFVRSICAVFDRHLDPGAARHGTAI